MLNKKLFAVAIFTIAFGLAGVASAFTFDSKIDTLQEKKDVQTTLNMTGANLTVDGVFGPLTLSAVKTFQTMKGLTVDGIIGAMTRAALTAASAVGQGAGTSTVAGCTSTAGFSPLTGASCASVSTLPAGCTAGALFSSTTGVACVADSNTVVAGMVGTDGTISDINQISSYSNEEVGDGSKDVKVMGFDVVASNDGDIALKSIKLIFDGADSTGSTRLADYLATVKVLMGSTVIGTASTTDFTKDSTGVYSKVISFASNPIVKAEATQKIYVTVSAVSNLDSGDIATTADNWEVGISNIRYIDGSGVVTTVSNADLLLAGNMDYDATGDGIEISFVSFSASADTELKISKDTTSPVASVVKISATTDTAKSVLLKGKLKLEGTSNVLLDSMPILFTTSETNLTDVTPTVYLTIGSQEFSESTTATAANNETVAFDNLDLTLIAGSTVNFTVYADLNDIQATSFDEGTTLKAELTTGLRDGATFVAENSQGDQLVDSTEKTGSALGEVQTYRSTGVSVALVGTPTVTTTNIGGSASVATYTMVFDVTAFGADMYVSGMAPTIAGTTGGTNLDIAAASANVSLSAEITTTTGATRSGTLNAADSAFLVSETETERFTITAVVSPTNADANGLTSISIAGIGYDDDLGQSDQLYSSNLTSFVTPSANLKFVN